MRVGCEQQSPSVAPFEIGMSRARSARAVSRILRISEKPFECGPLEARPSSASPGRDRRAVDRLRLLDDAHREAGEIVLAAG